MVETGTEEREDFTSEVMLGTGTGVRLDFIKEIRLETGTEGGVGL